MIIDCKNSKDFGLYYNEKVLPYAFAVKELNKYLQKTVGFIFQNKTNQKYTISIGLNDLFYKEIGEECLYGIEHDGFKIIVKNSNIYIFSKVERGTIFGVYEFLERFLGVRWFNVDCTVTPKSNAIKVEENEICCSPIFPQRNYLSYFAMSDEKFSLHLRNFSAYSKKNKKYGIESEWFVGIPQPHNSTFYVPKTKYLPAHPEFYARDNGQPEDELCYTNGLTDDGNIDYSLNESVVLAVAESLIEFKKASPKSKYFMFGLKDNREAYCHCERCENARKKFGGMAGLMMVFLNAVIKQIKIKYEKIGKVMDFDVVTFAYALTVEPPVNGVIPVSDKVIPDEHLYIRYAPIDADYTFSLIDERQLPNVRRQVVGWTALTKNIMIWDYTGNYIDSWWYFSNLSYIKTNLSFYKEMNVQYVMNQGTYNIEHCWQDDIKAYIFSKLYWNIDLDVNVLLKEYINNYYGLAADDVFEFIDMIEDFFANLIEKGFRFSILSILGDYFNPEKYPIDLLEKWIKILNSAVKKVKESDLSFDEKDILVLRLNRVLFTPLRMVLRNREFYEKQKDISNIVDLYYEVGKKISIAFLGEEVPFVLPIIDNTQSKYRIVVGKNATEQELISAKYLQQQLNDRCDCCLPIVDDGKVFPRYKEFAICIGDNMMFREFYKGTVDISKYRYYIQTKGWCVFINSKEYIQEAIEVFTNDILQYTYAVNTCSLVDITDVK